jgi:glycerol-3-phosphate dehydrogenase
MIDLPDTCDLAIIGGGVTGAGIFYETACLGLKVVLFEQHDFAWGTSSRSSKLIHGGLRYLKEGHLLLTRDAVKERERLLREAPGLVTPLAFVVPIYKDRSPGRWTLEAGLSLYDLLAARRRHRFLKPEEIIVQVPFIERKALIGGYEFWDAQVDDARLVLRLISEGRLVGGRAYNYTAALSIDRDAQGRVSGVTLQDTESLEVRSIRSQAVINATGYWAERLHPQTDLKRRLRPLRGSHLVFPRSILPVQCAVSFMHPHDQRPVFVLPWEGAVLVGTTDLDHSSDLKVEPTITEEEAEYLLEGVRALFPSLGLSLDQCIASLAGLRSVISSDADLSPSEESREHDIWIQDGLVTIAGGKLTTYRRVALDALKAVQPFLPKTDRLPADGSGFDLPETPPKVGNLDPAAWERLSGRYGKAALLVVADAAKEDLEPIPGTRTLWAELAYAARHESVRHLSDLLLRRVRIGLLLPEGGMAHMGRIERLCRTGLGWKKNRWRREVKQYVQNWRRAHGFQWKEPEPSVIRRILNAIGGKLGARGLGKMKVKMKDES